MESISSLAQIDERRALVMTLQALLDPATLAVLAALHNGERSMAELARELDVTPSLSRGPIGQLVFLELVAVRQDAGRLLCQRNDARLSELSAGLRRLRHELFADEARASAVADAAGFDEVRQRMLDGYLLGERLVRLPDDPEHLHVVLCWLVAPFEPGRAYPEREVNERLSQHHDDVATLRRALVDSGLMLRAHNQYWRGPTLHE
jgi:DNA-binding transcriptional ArsR family regulator